MKMMIKMILRCNSSQRESERRNHLRLCVGDGDGDGKEAEITVS